MLELICEKMRKGGRSNQTRSHNIWPSSKLSGNGSYYDTVIRLVTKTYS